jgi:hypothetical protein
VDSMAVDGQRVEPSDSQENPLGPLPARHVMHATMVLIPSKVGSGTLHLRVFDVATGAHPLTHTTVRATIER